MCLGREFERVGAATETDSVSPGPVLVSWEVESGGLPQMSGGCVMERDDVANQ